MDVERRIVRLLKDIGASRQRTTRHVTYWRLPNGNVYRTTARPHHTLESHAYKNSLADLKRAFPPLALVRKSKAEHLRADRKKKWAKTHTAAILPFIPPAASTVRSEPFHMKLAVAVIEHKKEVEDRDAQIERDKERQRRVEKMRATIALNRFKEKPSHGAVRTFTPEFIAEANRIRLESGEAVYQQFMQRYDQDRHTVQFVKANDSALNLNHQPRKGDWISMDIKDVERSISDTKAQIVGLEAEIAAAEQKRLHLKQLRDMLASAEMFRDQLKATAVTLSTGKTRKVANIGDKTPKPAKDYSNGSDTAHALVAALGTAPAEGFTKDEIFVAIKAQEGMSAAMNGPIAMVLRRQIEHGVVIEQHGKYMLNPTRIVPPAAVETAATA
jgi:hypothetical protein